MFMLGAIFGNSWRIKLAFKSSPWPLLINKISFFIYLINN
ncbi:hypothetical protein CWATWH0005_1644 [Crocosphaera watsonii WH 0005]|uniref:Uncharacterized protein n=1 Tax=Crocosphaera watsonii WH 0005 TaxID=423472 RepID=T2IR41_CROWT|nr:hypothetical protein CWATWH0005_1644 [Crocosphaera watsonii WH 0005]